MSRREGVAAVKVIAHPTATGFSCAVVVSRWHGRDRVDRVVYRAPLDLGDEMSVDNPGPALLALSDALAQYADTLARAR